MMFNASEKRASESNFFKQEMIQHQLRPLRCIWEQLLCVKYNFGGYILNNLNFRINKKMHCKGLLTHLLAFFLKLPDKWIEISTSTHQFLIISAWHCSKNHGNAVGDGQHEADFAVGDGQHEADCNCDEIGEDVLLKEQRSFTKSIGLRRKKERLGHG